MATSTTSKPELLKFRAESGKNFEWSKEFYREDMGPGETAESGTQPAGEHPVYVPGGQETHPPLRILCIFL